MLFVYSRQGGNPTIQASFLSHFRVPTAERFFAKIHQSFLHVILEIKSFAGTDDAMMETNTPEIVCSGATLRLMQLLCENHNILLQNYLRKQTNSKNSYNLVQDALQFLDSMCGSSIGGFGLLGLYINEHNVGYDFFCLYCSCSCNSGAFGADPCFFFFLLTGSLPMCFVWQADQPVPRDSHRVLPRPVC